MINHKSVLFFSNILNLLSSVKLFGFISTLLPIKGHYSFSIWKICMENKVIIIVFNTSILLNYRTSVELELGERLRGLVIRILPDFKYCLILYNNPSCFTWFSSLNLGTSLLVENEASPSVNPTSQ